MLLKPLLTRFVAFFAPSVANLTVLIAEFNPFVTPFTTSEPTSREILSNAVPNMSFNLSKGSLPKNFLRSKNAPNNPSVIIPFFPNILSHDSL